MREWHSPNNLQARSYIQKDVENHTLWQLAAFSWSPLGYQALLNNGLEKEAGDYKRFLLQVKPNAIREDMFVGSLNLISSMKTRASLVPPFSVCREGELQFTH
ncbi:unnamed protein product [Protopolystoma xenopodis]|uniref:Uncharacterized protein n=1 Tax=Protopolystoma xenopodis TaxID=117903 RepID=A0A448WX99_9PLAT|nr:unnamed protein product [Protopolystoma xenopodis]